MSFTPVWQVLGLKPIIGQIKKGKINFQQWTKEDREDFYESWDDPEYFRNLYEADKEKTYDFKIYNDRDTNELLCEIVNDDERDGTIFYKHEVIF